MLDVSGKIVYSSMEKDIHAGFRKEIATESVSAVIYMLRVTATVHLFCPFFGVTLDNVFPLRHTDCKKNNLHARVEYVPRIYQLSFFEMDE